MIAADPRYLATLLVLSLSAGCTAVEPGSLYTGVGFTVADGPAASRPAGPARRDAAAASCRTGAERAQAAAEKREQSEYRGRSLDLDRDRFLATVVLMAVVSSAVTQAGQKAGQEAFNMCMARLDLVPAPV